MHFQINAWNGGSENGPLSHAILSFILLLFFIILLPAGVTSGSYKMAVTGAGGCGNEDAAFLNRQKKVRQDQIRVH